MTAARDVLRPVRELMAYFRSFARREEQPETNAHCCAGEQTECDRMSAATVI